MRAWVVKPNIKSIKITATATFSAFLPSNILGKPLHTTVHVLNSKSLHGGPLRRERSKKGDKTSSNYENWRNLKTKLGGQDHQQGPNLLQTYRQPISSFGL